MPTRWKSDVEFLEEGNIFFFYLPNEHSTKVENFFIILDPYDQPVQRLINVMSRGMPAVKDGRERSWTIVDQVGVKFAVGDGRPAGEGVYALVRHEKHIHLVYALELPNRVGQVQKELNIGRQGNYIAVAFHPETHKYVPATGDLLNTEGMTMLLIGVGADVSRLGLVVNKERETVDSADLFEKLEIRRDDSKTAPLIKGKWK
jgi:hypothetical protein